MLLLLGVRLPVHGLLLQGVQRPCVRFAESRRLWAGLLRLQGQLRAIPQAPGQVRMLQEGLLRCRELPQVSPRLMLRGSRGCRMPLHGCARSHPHARVKYRWP